MDGLRFLKCIVVIRTPFVNYDLNAFQERYNKIQIYTLDEIEKLGNCKEKSQRIFQEATKDDVSVIMYTSGSTGVPKGVMVTHENLLCSVRSFAGLLNAKSASHTYIAYLPLAHILELTSELCCLMSCIRIGYSSTITLTDTSTGIIKGQVGDVRILKPTILVTVPLMMERVAKAVIDKVEKSSVLRRTLFKKGMIVRDVFSTSTGTGT
jgi:long-chain acyl-CoA synthetase